MKNPCCPNGLNEENNEAYRQYRYYVISVLPTLKILDAHPISDRERIYVKNHKDSIKVPNSTKPVIFSPLTSDTLGIIFKMHGNLMLLDEDTDYIEWDPYHFKIGDGLLLYFINSRSIKPEGVIPLIGYCVDIVDDRNLLKKVPPEYEIIRLSKDNCKTYYLVLESKDQLERWIPYIIEETQNELTSQLDWNDLQKRMDEYRKKTSEIKQQSSLVRLKRTLDESYSIDPKEIKFIKVLGNGSFGTVYKASIRKKLVAVKVFHNQNMTEEFLNDFCNEVEIISKIHHPQIIRFIGACLDPLMIVTELMEGDLKHLLKDKTNDFPLLTRLKIARDAALGMTWLHGSNPMIIHRDIKPENFLYDSQRNIVVSDFGFADTLRKGSSTWNESGFKGSMFYTSPELLKNSEFSEKVDVYSFGIVLWELYTREEPYSNIKEMNFNELHRTFINKVAIEGIRPKIPEDCPTKLRDLIQSCWMGLSDKRPSFEEIVDSLEEIIFEESIKDEKGITFWKTMFPGKDKVNWNQFYRSFSMYIEGPLTQNDYEILKKLIIPYYEFEDQMKKGLNSVWRESLGNFLCLFGPIHDKFNILDEIKKIIKYPWFFGYMTMKESISRLYGRENGTFLVRLSNEHQRYFIISYTSKSKVKHLFIERKIEYKDGIPYSIFSICGSESKYLLLRKLIENHKELETPCPGSPFL